MSSGSRSEDDMEDVRASNVDAAALQALADRLFLAREAEKGSVARRLHNGAGQALTAITMAAHAIKCEPDEQQRKIDLGEILVQAEAALSQIREICSLLRPAPLDALGLAAALRWHLAWLQQDAGAKLVLEAPEPRYRPAPEVEQACFRIAEQAVSNALSHARATTVVVRVEDVDGGFVMAVHDDGRGFDAQSVTGPGLVEMRERARGINACFSMVSALGHGTCVRVQVPDPGVLDNALPGAVQ